MVSIADPHTGRIGRRTCMSGAVHIIERDLIRDRTVAGLDAARARGRRGGRPKTMTAAKLVLAQQMRRADPPASYEVIAQALGLGKTTVRRHL